MTKSPTPEGPSLSGDRADSVEHTEQRRLPRLNLSDEQFRFNENGKIYSVSNFSWEGMAFRLLDETDSFLFPVGREIQGILKMEDHKLQVTAKVTHVDSQQVGAMFKALDEKVSNVIREYLDPRHLGKLLKSMPTPNAEGLWLHGPSETEVLLRMRSDGSWGKMTITLLGQLIQWDNETGLQTGKLDPAGKKVTDHGLLHVGTFAFHPDGEPDVEKVQMALAMIECASIPEPLLKICRERLAR